MDESEIEETIETFAQIDSTANILFFILLSFDH